MSVLNALSPPHNTDPVVQKWLKGDAISRHFVNIVDQCVSEKNSFEESALLKAALTETPEGSRLLIGYNIVNIIIIHLLYFRFFIKQHGYRPYN